jgi:hypothetical protein
MMVSNIGISGEPLAHRGLCRFCAIRFRFVLAAGFVFFRLAIIVIFRCVDHATYITACARNHFQLPSIAAEEGGQHIWGHGFGRESLLKV